MAPVVDSEDLLSTVEEAWNTILFEKFSRFRHLLVDGLSNHSNEVLARQPFKEGMRVIDIGCGFGDSTVRIAHAVGPRGRAVGVDCAERFIDEARLLAQQEQLGNAEFLVRNVQIDDLGGPYDAAFARFGTMFFTMPGAAMRVIRRSLAPGAEFTQIVWRRKEDNPWLYEAELRVREIVPVVPHDETDQVHCGPGPFSMADANLVTSILGGVGFERASLERFDADICIGRDLEEAIEFAMALGPSGEIIRLAGEEGERLRPKVADALREALSSFVGSDGRVMAPSSTWFVRARAPLAS